jgi:hypothetical protein
MNNAQILSALDKAGEALTKLGEANISLGYHAEFAEHLRYSVGLPAGRNFVEVFGHASSPQGAFVKALAKRADKEAENALRARIQAEVEERLRSEMQREAA